MYYYLSWVYELAGFSWEVLAWGLSWLELDSSSGWSHLKGQLGRESQMVFLFIVSVFLNEASVSIRVTWISYLLTQSSQRQKTAGLHNVLAQHWYSSASTISYEVEE